MGQTDSKEIQENLTLLQKENIIQHSQVQKFLHDYHTNDDNVKDVKNFEENKLKIFLKYFVLEKYSSRHLEKQTSRRVKTNQSAYTEQDKNFDNLGGIVCFQTYRIQEKFENICKIVRNSLLCHQTIPVQTSIKEIFNCLGIKECIFLTLAKTNIQQFCLNFESSKSMLLIKKSQTKQNSFPKSQTHKFRKLKKQQLLQQRYIISENASSELSQSYYVHQNPMKQKTNVLIVTFKQSEIMEIKMQKKQMKNLIQRFVSDLSQFIISLKQVALSENKSLKQLKSTKQHSQKEVISINKIRNKNQQNSSNNGINKNQNSQVCWNLMKIYKSEFQFRNLFLVQRIKNDHKKTLNLTNSDTTFQDLKAKVQQLVSAEECFNEDQQNQNIVFFSQYEARYLKTKKNLCEYLQKLFKSMSQEIFQLQFDQNTVLKMIISSSKNNQLLINIRAVIENASDPTLLDVFKGQTAFQQFYKQSYQTVKREQKQCIFSYKGGVSLNFILESQYIVGTKIKITNDFLNKLQKTDEMTIKMLDTKKENTPKQEEHKFQRKPTHKKKFSALYNSTEVLQDEKQNIHQREEQSIKSFEDIKIHKLNEVIKVKKNSVKKYSVLDLTTIQAGEQYNLYDPDLNILEISPSNYIRLAHNIFIQLDYFKKNQFKPNQKMVAFLQQLRNGYQEHNNPFHNFSHGLNVMHTAFLLSSRKNTSQILSDFSKLVLVLSALCHDVGHTGFNNAFQIATNSPLAQAFNDSSPLQNYHISRTLSLLKNENTNFLDFLSSDEKIKLRKLLISNILNTDMKEHFNVLKKFQQKKVFKKDDIEDEKIICGMLIHSSDFGGSIKQFSICQQWSKKVNQQFTHQSKRQLQLGIPISPFMVNLDNNLIMAKNELGFLKFMVQPLYKSLSQYFLQDQMCKRMFNRVDENINKWDQTIKKITELQQLQLTM